MRTSDEGLAARDSRVAPGRDVLYNAEVWEDQRAQGGGEDFERLR